jgi:hypothetical protein
MSITVTNAWSSITDSAKDISDISDDTKLRGASYVNQAIYNALSKNDSERVISAQSVSVVVGTATYTLPTNFETINAPNCGVFIVDNGVDTNAEYAYTGFGNSSQGYYVSGGDLVITPVPTATATLKLRYIPKVNNFTALSDTFCCEDRFLEHVSRLLLVFYKLQDNNTFDFQMFSQLSIPTLNDFVQNISRVPRASPVISTAIYY